MKSLTLGLTLLLAVMVTAFTIPVSVNSGLSPFTDVTELAGVEFQHHKNTLLEAGAGAAFLDYDGDGTIDLYLTDANGPNALFGNNGDGTFTDVTFAAGIGAGMQITRGVACGDYDNDGDVDIYLLNEGPNTLFRNNGDGTFTDVTDRAGVGDPSRSQSASFGDYDNDGFLDLYVGNYVNMQRLREDKNDIAGQANRLYHNNGDGTFTELAAEMGVANDGTALAVTFTDYDGDGDPDILVANDFGPQGLPPNALYRNDGPGDDGRTIFTDVSQTAHADVRLFSMGIASGDYDNDGDLDYYITSIIDNVFHRNNGDGTFTDVARENGTLVEKSGEFWRINWGTEFFDYDNDGTLDLYVVSGPIFSENPQSNLLFLNNGDATFRDIAAEVGVDHPGVGRGCIFADYDGDGDVDLFLTNYDHQSVLYRNEYYQTEGGDKNNWLQVKLVGVESNRDGIGARLRVEAGGMTQTREIGSGSPHSSQSSLRATFGVGKAETVERLQVHWPSGIVQVMLDVPVNRQITLVEQ